MEKIDIRKLRPSDDTPYELIRLADESSEAIADYVSRGECWVAECGGGVVGEFILLQTRPFTVELINVAVREDMQGRGIGKAMVRRAIDIARSEGYRRIEVGTGNAGIGQIALYQKCGFSISGIDSGFFSRLYPEPFSEHGIECRDMVRMRLEL